eukprot:COSAG02_NODE_1860_length_10613_cov_40.769831_2_plen_128_part_00
METHIHTERERELMDTHTHTHRERQRDTERERQRDRETERQRDRDRERVDGHTVRTHGSTGAAAAGEERCCATPAGRDSLPIALSCRALFVLIDGIGKTLLSPPPSPSSPSPSPQAGLESCGVRKTH